MVEISGHDVKLVERNRWLKTFAGNVASVSDFAGLELRESGFSALGPASDHSLISLATPLGCLGCHSLTLLNGI